MDLEEAKERRNGMIMMWGICRLLIKGAEGEGEAHFVDEGVEVESREVVHNVLGNVEECNRRNNVLVNEMAFMAILLLLPFPL